MSRRANDEVSEGMSRACAADMLVSATEIIERNFISCVCVECTGEPSGVVGDLFVGQG